MRLQWSHAAEPDRAVLQNFVCTEAAPRHVNRRTRKTWGRFWEREVQSGVRDLRPPASNGEIILLGRDEDGLAAVGWAYRVDAQEWKVLLGAIHIRLRRNHEGYRYGDEVLDAMLNAIRAASVGEVLVWAYIHDQNTASAALADRSGWQYIESENELQRWGVLVPCGDE